MNTNFDSAPKDQSFYRGVMTDYANIPMRLGAIFLHAKENPLIFREWLVSHPEDCERITHFKGMDLQDGFKEYYAQEATEIDDLIERIKTENDPRVIKQMINKILFIIYPKKGLNQWFEEEEFSGNLL